MRRSTATMVAVTVLLGASAASVMAGPGMMRDVVGVIASVERHSPATLQITTKSGKVQEVRTDAKTRYVKWTTRKEGPQVGSVDSDALVVGRCVDVEPHTGDPHSAKIVRISNEPAGSASIRARTVGRRPATDQAARRRELGGSPSRVAASPP